MVGLGVQFLLVYICWTFGAATLADVSSNLDAMSVGGGAFGFLVATWFLFWPLLLLGETNWYARKSQPQPATNGYDAEQQQQTGGYDNTYGQYPQGGNRIRRKS
eukprot:GABV01002264.1.p2 GENE.GABV01002264.1~~GABV01002264.1.p2  ORF type:complete len:104 (-),score=35.84 GABV01002264.1:38-349(-)